MKRKLLFITTALLLVGCSTSDSADPEDYNSDDIQTEELEAQSETNIEEDTGYDNNEPVELPDKLLPGTRHPLDVTVNTVVNDNIPQFSNEDIVSTETYHRNSPLDNIGRSGVADAVVGVDIMPAEQRGDISNIYPSGWKQARYAGISSGGWLYNRSHLIGHQMTGNDDAENLMTGTRDFNMAMLEYENFVADYVERTENHVRYRVTPVYEGDNLVASGIYMEAFSIEDNGEGVMFHVYVPNIQPDVEIDYATGLSNGPEGPAEDGDIEPYMNPIDPGEGSDFIKEITEVDTDANGTVTIQEAKDAGYEMPITSDHWLYPYMNDADGDGKVGE